MTHILHARLTGKAFSLMIEQKDGFWVVTAPDVHVGLHIVHRNLLEALIEAPTALSMLLKHDGDRRP